MREYAPLASYGLPERNQAPDVNDSPKSAEYPRLYQKKFTTIELKRGTHGTAEIGIAIVVTAGRTESAR